VRLNRWILGVVACLAAATAAADCRSLAEFRWLLGEWLADGERRTFHESWIEAASNTFEGTGIERAKAGGAVKGGESLRLVEMADGIFYISKVDHNELPIAFRLTACGQNTWLFENPDHDFPRRIEYRREGEDRVVVNVSDGGEKGFTLDFHKVAPVASPAAAVLAAEDARFAAMIAANADEMRRRFAADLLYTHSSGKVESREALIETIVSGRIRYLEIEPTERDVGFPDRSTAIVRGRGRVKAVMGDQTLDLRLRYLAIYVLTDGNWQLRDWQSLREP